MGVCVLLFSGSNPFSLNPDPDPGTVPILLNPNPILCEPTVYMYRMAAANKYAFIYYLFMYLFSLVMYHNLSLDFLRF